MKETTGPRREEYETSCQWFRERVQDVHGIDLQSGPPPESQQIHDHTF
jgi:hypothetical protein